MKEFAYNSLKIIHDLDRIKDMREGKIVPPKTVRIDLNTICNHGCSFCLYQSFNNGLKSINLNTEMPSQLQIDENRLIKLIKEFEDCGVNSLVFLGGGEPTIHPSFEKIIEATNNTKLEYGIITNGSRIDRILPYKEAQGFKWIRVSLDAAEENTWKRIHNPKGIKKYEFKTILENVKKLQNERSDFFRGLSFIVGKDNYQEIYKFIKMGQNLGIDNVRIGLEYGGGFDSRNSNLIPLAVEQIEKGKKDFESKHFNVFDRVSKRKDDISNERDYSACGFKELSTNLGADLNLYTCCFGKYTPSHRIGSLKEKSFAELWFNSKKEFLKKFSISNCPPCWYGETNRILEYVTQKNPPHSNFID
jgi:MoaA/NifB/PqqE/SkfB family radical SAM enzyme